MDKHSQGRLVDLTIAGAVTVFVPVVAYVVWSCLSPWTTSAPQGMVLTYEVDPDPLLGTPTVDMEQLTNAVDRRVNSEPRKLAQVQQLDDRRIEVALLRQDDADTQRVEHLLARTATLEFRILANDWHNKSLIDRAMANPAKVQILDGKGKLLAWWVPVKAGEEASLADYTDIARRTKKEGKHEITEVLVVKDDYNITGVYLKRAEAGFDRLGRPRLSLIFKTKGAQLCQQLTGSHLPDKAADRNYKLGILVNGELYSAPLLVTTIFDRAQIGSSFTKQEVDELASMLNTGALPARIRLVTKKESP
jgi:SecD/SecF fusion protein